MSNEPIFHEKKQDEVRVVDELSEEDLLEVSGGASPEPTSPTVEVNDAQTQFSSASNVLKTRHDTVKNSISN
jgi:hypothetical protein